MFGPDGFAAPAYGAALLAYWFSATLRDRLRTWTGSAHHIAVVFLILFCCFGGYGLVVQPVWRAVLSGVSGICFLVLMLPVYGALKQCSPSVMFGIAASAVFGTMLFVWIPRAVLCFMLSALLSCAVLWLAVSRNTHVVRSPAGLARAYYFDMPPGVPTLVLVTLALNGLCTCVSAFLLYSLDTRGENQRDGDDEQHPALIVNMPISITVLLYVGGLSASSVMRSEDVERFLALSVFHARHATLLAVWCAGVAVVCIAVLLFIMVLAQRSEASPVLVVSSIMLPVFAGVLSYGWLDVAVAEAGGMLQICAPVGVALGLVSLTFALRMLKRRASLRAQSNSELVQHLCARSELTKTECEVAVRLARGMNARQIADDLVGSPATVASHLKRIYAKLGIHGQQDICQVLFTN